MPTIATKIMYPSSKHLFLYKEGVFWVAYEQSAYFFAQLKGYKPTKKYYKNINKWVVSVGFPQADDLLNNLQQNNTITWVNKTESSIEMLLAEEVSNTNFNLWKQNVKEKEQKITTNTTKKSSIEQLVKAFPLANKTPMEAFLFLKELQDLEQKSFQSQFLVV